MTKRYYASIVGFVFFLCAAPIFGQAISSVAVISPQGHSLLLTFEQEQQSLMQSFSAFTSNGSNLQQIQAWQIQNAAKLIDLRQQATAMASASAAEPMNYINSVQLPPDATQDMADFLTLRANLYNIYVEAHGQALTVFGTSETAAADSLQTSFQQQNATEIVDL